MRISLLSLLAIALIGGCDPAMKPTVNTAETGDATHPTVSHGPVVAPDATDSHMAGDSAAVEHPADDTAVNVRDRDAAAKTPIDQNENAADIKITADIRKRVMEQPDFSINAQNVKIITADGKVTLRGPVTTAAERETIDKIAREIAGSDHVDSQLEVVP